MGPVKSCCSKPTDDKLMVTKMDLSHCGCLEVPHVVFNAERCIETLILASNQISSLPPQLFHCQEMKHLNLNDNCLSSIPPAIGSFVHLISLKLDKNNLQELPDNLKMCKKLKRISLCNNPWKQMPNIVTQLINLEELYINDCELNYLPASVGRLSKLKIMELRNNNLCNLPLSVTRLELLARLDISDNEFTEFPPCIPKLKSLKELLMDNNDIEEIIDIKNLVHLEHLDASYNHILKVSEAIGCCICLSMLNLSFNYIEQLPNSIGNITYLQTLQLEMNELTELPKSIGKLIYLEELNLCNNKLHSLPNTIGLLRNLRNLNVSRNIIEEFPSEIGSCSKLGIINAAYNRLRVLPSEIGYLNNLKVLDLVGNFLMYLPITITNLRGVRAIWLSANQNIPLIPFTEDLNIASGERFLTNIALPQLGEIPLNNSNLIETKSANNEKTMWNKKISFAEDEDNLPGRLHRTPTPFPKELRAPNRKHIKNEEPKRNDNYVNVIDGKVSEQPTPLLPPTCVSVGSKEGAEISDVCTSQIREASIRRNNKDLSFEVISQNKNQNNVIHAESEPCHETKIDRSTIRNDEINILERQRMSAQVSKEDILPVTFKTADFNVSPQKTLTMPASKCANEFILPGGIKNEECVDGINYSKDECISTNKNAASKETSKNNFKNSVRHQAIYSNVVNGDVNRKNTFDETDSGEAVVGMNAQEIREMYHNDIIYESSKNTKFCTAVGRVLCKTDLINGNVENPPKHLFSSFSPFREHSFPQPSLGNVNREVCETIYSQSPETLSSYSAVENFSKKCKTDSATPMPSSTNESHPSELQQPLSKQDFISIAEQMKNRNIAPPCYEIAKMYSTKAALFENNRVEQVKFN